MSKQLQFMFFSPVQIALHKEIDSHPELMAYLTNHPTEDFETRLAEIARFCGIALDGDYDRQDIDNICGLCLQELGKRSTLILTP